MTASARTARTAPSRSARLRSPRRTIGLALTGLLLAGAALVAPRAHAQFASVPAVAPHDPYASPAADAQAYKQDAARHLYDTYPAHIHKGKLPPLMYAVAMSETDIDQDGHVVAVRIVREPAAAKEVSPWIVGMIRGAAPFPAPLGLSGTQTVREVWLVNKDGRFQLHTLSEGQASSSQHASAR